MSLQSYSDEARLRHDERFRRQHHRSYEKDQEPTRQRRRHRRNLRRNQMTKDVDAAVANPWGEVADVDTPGPRYTSSVDAKLTVVEGFQALPAMTREDEDHTVTSGRGLGARSLIHDEFWTKNFYGHGQQPRVIPRTSSSAAAGRSGDGTTLTNGHPSMTHFVLIAYAFFLTFGVIGLISQMRVVRHMTHSLIVEDSDGLEEEEGREEISSEEQEKIRRKFILEKIRNQKRLHMPPPTMTSRRVVEELPECNAAPLPDEDFEEERGDPGHSRWGTPRSSCSSPIHQGDTSEEQDVGHCCSICLGSFDGNEAEVGCKQCVHVYHEGCLVAWLMRKNTSCPCCRTSYFDHADVEGKYSEFQDDDEQGVSVADGGGEASTFEGIGIELFGVLGTVLQDAVDNIHGSIHEEDE